MLSDSSLPIIDLPTWEPVHNPAVSLGATTCWVSDGKNSIYYLAYSQLHRYDCDTDGWTRLADGLNAGTTTKSIVYTKWGGHFGKALSGTSNTISGAFGRGKSIIGKEIRIIGGTGIGQVRTITDVSEPVVGDFTIGTGNGEAITDTNKVYTKAQWIGYQVRIISGTGAGQTRPITTSCTSNNTIYVGDTAWVKAYFPQSSYSATSGAGTGSVFVIEYVTCTVDTNWDIPPDSSSLFEIASGAIWSLEYISSTVSPYCELHKYDVLFDYWEIKRPPIDYIPGGLTTDWHLETTQSDTKLEIGTADSGSLTTLVDNSKSFGVNKYTNCRVFITKGTGIGQQRTILSNDSSSITVCKPFTISPSSDSEYYITHDVDKIWFYCIEYGGLLQYSIEFDEWSCGNIRDYGLLGEMTFVTDGGKVCTDFQSFSVSNNTASINTNFATDVASGDYITVYGASQSQLNGRHQINYSNSFSANPYTVSSANLTATPITYMGQTYYTQISITGSIYPYVYGVYTLKGIYNNKPYYQRGDDAFYIWWRTYDKIWIIANILGSTSDWSFYSSLLINPSYINSGTATGNPVVNNVISQVIYYNTITVSGTLTPDATGVYTCKGLFRGLPYYQRGDDSFLVFYDGANYYIVPLSSPNSTDPEWFNGGMGVATTYIPYGTAVGTPTVTNNTSDRTYYNQVTVSSGYYNQITVSGSLTPDATGTYTYVGMYNNAPYYQRGSDSYYLWYNSTYGWNISITLGTLTIGWYNWGVASGPIVNSYSAGNGAVGTATIANVTASGIQPNTLYPNVEGTYTAVGIDRGSPYYKRGSDNYYLWFNSKDLIWTISTAVGANGSWAWYKSSLSGLYLNYLASQGPLISTPDENSGIYSSISSVPYQNLPIINTNATFVDCTKNWIPNEHAGRILSIPEVSPYKHYILSNTETTLTVSTIITDISQYLVNWYKMFKYVIMDLKAFGAMEEDHNISYYSNYYKQIRVSGIFYNQVEVTGSLTPDATGVYTYAGMYNGYPYYRRGGDNWYIWADPSGAVWRLVNTSTIGTFLTLPRWDNTIVNIAGIYTNISPAVGSATVVNVLSSGLIENVTVTPNVEGVYTAKGIYNGAPYYQRGDEDYYLFKVTTVTWDISGSIGLVPYPGWHFYLDNPNLLSGNFTSYAASSGFAMVTNIESEGRYLDIPHSSGYGYSSITTGSNTLTLQDSTKNWMVNRLAGKTFRPATNTITNSSGEYGLRTVMSNTSNIITLSSPQVANAFNNIAYKIFANVNSSTGMKLIWVYNCSDPLVGYKYIYRVKGGNLIPCMDRFNLETETWEEFNIYPNSEQFTTGTMAVYDGADRIYIHHNNTGKIVYLNLLTNMLVPFSQVPFCNSIGTAILGNRMVIMKSSDGSKYLYLTRNISGAYEMYRLLLPNY